MTIATGRLICVGGKAVPAYGDPGFWLTPAVAPKTAIVDLNITDVTSSVEFGMDADTTGNITGYAYRITADTLKPVKNSTVGPALFVPADNTEYTFYISVSDKVYYFAKGGTLTYPTLLWLDSVYALTTAYLGLSNFDAIWQADNLRMVSGAVAATVLSSIQTAPMPTTTGSELLTNPGFEGTYVAGVAPNWTNSGSGTAAEENTIKNGGTSAQKLTRVANSDRVTATATSTAGTWYLATMYQYSAQAGGTNVRLVCGTAIGNSVYGEARLTPVSTWTQLPLSLLATSTTIYAGMWLVASGTIGYADDASVKELLLSSLINTEDTGSADGMFDVDVTVPIGLHGGLALNVDSASSPANLVLVTQDQTNIIVRKCVAGTWTTVSTTAATYVAGATLRVWRSGSTYRTYYNKLFVKTDTISDVGILSNTRHGRFLTHSSVTLANYAAYAIGGSAASYAALDLM